MSSLVRLLSRPTSPLEPRCIADEDSAKIPDVSIVEASAELLYGLVHQRYVLTRAGLHAMVSEPLTRSASEHIFFSRRKSTKRAFLAHAHASTVWAAMSSHVDGRIFRG
jgi:hypothetical protein